MSNLSLREIAQSQLDSTPVIDGQLIVCLDTGNAYRDTATAHVKIGSDLEVVSDLPLAPLAEKLYYLKPDKLYVFLGGNWTLLNDKTIDLDEVIAKLPAGSSTSLNDDVEIITQDTDITQSHYYRRKLVVLWEYIKTKAQDFFAAKNHKHEKADITDFPTSMPASDVYPWAKAATKPSYTKAEVGLGKVDNTADADKIVKRATTAGTADSANSVAWENVKNKPTAFPVEAHNHDDRYYTEAEMNSKLSGKVDNTEAGVNGLINKLSTADGVPNDATVFISQHNDGKTPSYYRRPISTLWTYIKSKADSVYQTKGSYATSNHSHDDRYYTESEMDGKLNSKVNNNEAGANGLFSKLTTSWTATPTDDTYFIRQDTGGGNTFGRVKFSTIWNYIKGKADGTYQPKGSYAVSEHTHDDRYYTEAEVDGKLSGKSNTGHTHDDRYYTESEINSKLSGKADVNHIHLNGTVSGDVDWNTFIKYGVYKIQNCTMNDTYHAPNPEYQFGILQVLDSENNVGEKRIIQIYWPHITAKGNHLWYRMHNSSDINAGWSGWVPIKNKPDASGISDVTNALSGFTPRSGQNWGVQTGTFVHGEGDSTGGDFAFRRDCPNAGQVSMVLDGRFYQNEGQYRVLDTSDEPNLNVNSANFAKETYINRYKTVNLTDLDQNTWYPVTGTSVQGNGLRHFKCSVQLNSGSKPSWSTHSAGFTAVVDIIEESSGWGTTGMLGEVLINDQRFIADESKPPVGYYQMSYGSVPVWWLRGGGTYFLAADYDCTWTIRKSTYTNSGQSVSPTTTYPGVGVNRSTITANLNGNANTATNATNASNSDKWAGLSWRHNHNTTDTWIPVVSDNAFDYILKHEISADKLPLTGGTISGALNFANGTWNLVGDDAYMGDHNIGGSFCIMGANDTTRLALVNKDNQGDYALVEYGGGNLNFNKKLGANITGHADGDLSLGGGTLTGDIAFSNCGTGVRQIQFTCADNDFGRVAVGGTASNAGYMEIATADDGNEPIYVRQYSGVYASIVRSASLLDGNGNTSFPGAVTANTYYAPNWFRATGDSGFYFENHGGGWYMIDDTWIRAYNNKNIYTPGVIQCDSGFNGNLNGNATTSTLVRHQGNVTAISGTATRTAGLQLYGAYTNGYPMAYGNVICASNGAFGSEIALDCVGGGGKQGPGRMYYRNRSDWGTSEWSDWATVAYLTDKVAGAGTADKAEYLGNDAAYMRMHWNGQGGQPTWLWGGNDASNMYVWNPSNFSVNYANSAGNGVVASGYNYVRFGDGTQICWGQQDIGNAGTTITFAVAFSSIPAVVNSGTEDIDDVFFVRNITTTNFVADKIGWFSGNNTWIAIGRWK